MPSILGSSRKTTINGPERSAMTLQRKVSQRSLKAISTELDSGEASSFDGFISGGARVFNSGYYILVGKRWSGGEGLRAYL